jgi:NADP-dependent 3-hydroxy acid dehydrogenase YdfG
MTPSRRVAIVTGASAGIGHATALALAKQDIPVVLHARRRERLEELARQIQSAGGRALPVPGDASNSADIDALLKRAEEFAKSLGADLDIVVVNAGRGLAGGLLSSDQSQWRAMFELNVLGAAHLMRRAGELMAPRGHGDIVVLGSASGHNVSPFSGFYGSSKFALAAMAEAFRREVCAKGLRISILKPGIVLSEFQAAAGYGDAFYKTIEKYGKPLEPADVAEAIRFVVSLPPHVAVNELVIRPTGQDYP